MPDFLNRLAARALGVLPVAEPLVSMRFDPGTRHVDLAPFDAISESVDGATRRQALATPLKSGFVRFDLPVGDLDDATPLNRSEQRRVSRLRDLQQPLANKTRSSSANAKSTPIARATPSVSPSVREAEDAVPHSSDANLRPALPLFAEPRPASINAVSESSRAASPHSQSGDSAVRGMPPVVRVSIGRIEVRAEMPERALAPAPQRLRSSHVSLDQFLKQAGGGTR